MLSAIRSGRTLPHAVTLAVFALALALRTLVPVGWMPVSDAQGFRIVLCSGTGPVEMPGGHHMTGMHHDDSAPAGQDHDKADHPCVFAGLGLALTEALPPALAQLAPQQVSPGLIAALTIAIGHGLAAPPPPATGPPLPS